jgi:asparagine synthase (glutamine-hydrolysing)
MCGIAGKIDFSGAVVPESVISRMCATVVHRGPDAGGTHSAPYIGLGERRLSIIDLAERANPPLTNEDATIWIVFNGEIYNFRELRATLIREGHQFRSQGDTEVVLHLYEKHGVRCVQHLRGMFAFGIWDSKKRLFFGARDRLGKKPFVYRKTPQAFLFGSSINVVRADSDTSSSPNFDAIDSYLTHQYVPSPLTAFSGISKLPPAHYLLCDTNGNLTIERYWSAHSERRTAASEQEIETELVRLLRESVRLRLNSDVPLGVFLSGGIDSGTIAALMAMESSAPVKSFSIGFEDEGFDELPFARLVATKYGLEHHEIIVKPSAADILPLLVQHYNEPFADSSAIPTYYVSRAARAHITVALSGDGGDENFLGYDHYRDTERWRKADFIPYPIRRQVANVMRSGLERFPYGNAEAKIVRSWRMFGSLLPDRYALQTSILKDEEKRAAYTPYFRSLLNGHHGSAHLTDLPWDESMDDWDWMARHDQNYYLPDCLMVKTDVASMANSLEVRSPFLDHHLVEFAATIPSSLKRDRQGGKAVLRRAVESLLPQEVLRKAKTGFGVPLAQWFRTNLRETLRGTLLDDKSAKRGLFKQKFLKRMVNEHIDGQRDWSSRLWELLILETWFREYVD